MARRVAVIEQPNYVPWLGYFDLMAQSDVFVWYDDVQYTKRDWRNRNLVAGAGQTTWLSVPVKTKGRFRQRILEVEADPQTPWVRKHLGTFRRLYAGAPHFAETYDVLAETLTRGHRSLADLTIALNETIARRLGVETVFRRSSELRAPGADRVLRLIEICRAVDADAYLSGPAAESYIEPQRFQTAGIELRYVIYDYPPYWRGAQPFEPRLSILDALAWLGTEGTASLLRQKGGRWRSPAGVSSAAE